MAAKPKYLDSSWVKYHPSVHLIRTPIVALNALNGGGLSMNSIGEYWGNSMSGKSTFVYQTGGLFLEDYGPRARILILDVEASANLLRLKHVFNIVPGFLENEDGNVIEVDTYLEPLADPRVTLCRAATVEGACTRIRHHMKKAADEGTFLYVVWDSITASVPSVEAEEFARAAAEQDVANAYKGGMMLKPRIIRQQLNAVMADMWFSPVFIAIINQASTYVTRFTSGEHSTGGYALKHNAHYRIHFDCVKTEKSDDGKVLYTQTKIEVEKSKYSPRIENVDIYIMDTAGGKIDPVHEAAWGMYNRGFFNAASGNYRVLPAIKEFMGDDRPIFEGSRKWKALTADEDGEVLRLYRDYLIKDYRQTFMLLDEFYKEREILLEKINNA